METTANILKIGNSCGVIIPSQIMKSLSLAVKDTLKLSEVNGKIILQKVSDTAAPSPFDDLDRWCEERGYCEDDAQTYISNIRAARKNKDIPQW